MAAAVLETINELSLGTALSAQTATRPHSMEKGVPLLSSRPAGLKG